MGQEGSVFEWFGVIVFIFICFLGDFQVDNMRRDVFKEF